MPGTRLTYVCVLVLTAVMGGCGSDPYCPKGLTWCWAKCVDLRSDERNCGKCNEKCGLNSYCEYGVCVCPFGFRAEGPDCIEDVPVCEGYGNVDCNGECVEILTDVRHCGACGNVCDFPNASANCIEGVCEMGVCEYGWGDCNIEQTDGCEIDLTANHASCGFCGNRCYDNEFCENGSCVHNEPECTEYPEVCDGQDNNCNDIVDEDPEASASCDDGNECTDDMCVVGQGCINIIIEGVSCDDGNPCTIEEVCRGGLCIGLDKEILPIDQGGCIDDICCTADSCDIRTGQCSNTPDNELCPWDPCDDSDPCFECVCSPGSGYPPCPWCMGSEDCCDCVYVNICR